METHTYIMGKKKTVQPCRSEETDVCEMFATDMKNAGLEVESEDDCYEAQVQSQRTRCPDDKLQERTDCQDEEDDDEPSQGPVTTQPVVTSQSELTMKTLNDTVVTMQQQLTGVLNNVVTVLQSVANKNTNAYQSYEDNHHGDGSGRWQNASHPQFQHDRYSQANRRDPESVPQRYERSGRMLHHYQESDMPVEDTRGSYTEDRRFRSQQRFQRPATHVKLPAFNGKDDWRVWINRFEAIAARYQWSDEDKLDNVLPKLQGNAGEFVFTQLPKQTLSDYKVLKQERSNRFSKIETSKTFAAKFSRRDQYHEETVEEYAAELKRLYDKAHGYRDNKTRQEDLVRRFLDGLLNDQARFEVEYNKEPESLEEAVYHVVNFIQTKRRNKNELYGEKKMKKFVRQVSMTDDDFDYDSSTEAEEDEQRQVRRVPAKEKQASKERGHSNKMNNKEPEVGRSEAENVKQTHDADILNKLLEKITELTEITQSKQKPQSRSIICFACRQPGHMARDCPTPVQGQMQRQGQGQAAYNNHNKRYNNTGGQQFRQQRRNDVPVYQQSEINHLN